MTLKELEQIIHMRSEVDVLRKRLEKERSKGNKFVADYANDYSTGQARTVTIQGYTTINTEKTNEINALIEARIKRLEKQIAEAEEYIDSVDDSKVRTLLNLRFIEGMEWDAVGKRFYKKMTADTARKTVARYFENN